ncbi:hypothetical protein Aple_079680 [Acrocarpospora pleiomorpha]|uniref:Uncharacterized protein n=1 Tax=Acrocarpospora pleiomorpha TaxID=90975 RepID=A0A5M3XYM2_9ACTN|nr:hypothetical protein Aple_079680 [Acrocarpospora pleiomorpha]
MHELDRYLGATAMDGFRDFLQLTPSGCARQHETIPVGTSRNAYRHSAEINQTQARIAVCRVELTGQASPGTTTREVARIYRTESQSVSQPNRSQLKRPQDR